MLIRGRKEVFEAHIVGLMTESVWNDCQDPEEMLEFLQGKTSDRKLRLFACACSRVSWRLLDEPGRRALETSERYADGLANLDELKAAAMHEPRGRIRGAYWNKVRFSPSDQATRAAFASTREIAWEAVWETVRSSSNLIQGLQCDLIRDVFGNPFRWNSIDLENRRSSAEVVTRLAYEIYEDRSFDLMPLLGVRLEENGLQDEMILAHCRSNAAHWRGCWVIDALVRKH